LDKIALYRLDQLSKEMGIPICPIVGVGSAPFRGNLRPETVDRLIKGYPSAYTFTIQSAFKYDNHPDEVMSAIDKLRKRTISSPKKVDEKRCLEIITKTCDEYRRQVTALAPVINRAAGFVPSRRKRKLHIGLFGYARNVGGVSLPRVITFTAALYSIGIPPEILGLGALTRDDINFLKEVYTNFEDDLRDALQYYNSESPFLTEEIRSAVSKLPVDFNTHKEHQEKAGFIALALQDNKTDRLGELILRAANIRKFLG
jgi:phosphoenolpyruvate carboxylase